MANSIYHTLPIDAAPQKVFAAITEPGQLEKWWPEKCTGIPEAGGLYNLIFTQDYNWFGKVASIVPNKHFSIKMTKSDADWDPTTFGFDLLENDGGTMLEFWHTDWPEINHHFKFSSYCWAGLLRGLKNYVEKGEVIPFSERE